MDKKLLLDKNGRVTIKNKLIRAPGMIMPDDGTKNSPPPKPMTTLQIKLIRQIISSVNDVNDACLTYHCNVLDFAKYIGMSKRIYYKLPDVIREMTRIQTELTEQDEYGRDVIKRINWVTTSEFTPQTGGLILKLNPDLIPYIVQLKDYYTTYEIENILSLPNPVTIRLYEYCISYFSLIQQNNKEGKPFVCTLEELRTFIGQGNKYKQDRDFVRLIKESANTVSAQTELAIQCTPIKRNGMYSFELFVRMKESQNKNDNEQIVTSTKTRDKYIYELTQYYADTVHRTVGKKLTKKIGECYDQFVRVGMVRQAIEDTAQKDQAGMIEKSVEAYARKMMDIYATGTLPLTDANQQLFDYDRVSEIEYKSFGSDDAARANYKRLVLSNEPLVSTTSEVSELETYIISIRNFAENTCKFNGIDYSFYRKILECYRNDIDIRVILNALWKSYLYMNDKDTLTFNAYAYATTIINSDIKHGNNNFDPFVSHMTLEWCLTNLKYIL